MEEENQFKKFALPLIKRIYPQLIADKINSTQPLSTAFPQSTFADRDYWMPIRPSVDDIGCKKKIWRYIDDPWEPSAQ